MVAALFCLAAVQDHTGQMQTLFDGGTHQEAGLLESFSDALNPPKRSPKTFGDPPKHWDFPWRTAVFGDVGGHELLRFVVFSQGQSEDNDRGPKVARMLARLWEVNYKDFQMDHSQEFGQRRVDVYLCFGGTPGGEQLFDFDPQPAPGSKEPVPGSKVDTIYLYDLNSFVSPMEMAREVAHEYGHATLPGIGGYDKPEYWANGYLGERLYLRHAEMLMSEGKLTRDDLMGATLPQLKVWTAANVDPLVARAAVSGPNPAELRDRSKAGMDAYLGLALYIDAIMPPRVFSRSMQMVGSSDAKDYPDSVVLAAQEPERVTLTIPSYLSGKPIWIPLGNGSLTGATVSRTSGDWALIRPGKGPVTIVPKHES